MKKKQIEIAARPADSSPITETMESNSLFTRREMLGMTGMAGLAALTGIAAGAVPQTQPPAAGRLAKAASYRLSRQLLGSADFTCGLDRKQAVGRLLVEGRPHSFAGGGGVGLHQSVGHELTGSESMQSEKHSHL